VGVRVPRLREREGSRWFPEVWNWYCGQEKRRSKFGWPLNPGNTVRVTETKEGFKSGPSASPKTSTRPNTRVLILEVSSCTSTFFFLHPTMLCKDQIIPIVF